MSRLEDLKKFYEILNALHEGLKGYRYLKECNGRLGWPEKGVYFFFEKGEQRLESGTGLRVVRVGTHAVSSGSRTTLWRRLYTHKGSQKNGGGNHRGSVFRELVGYSLAAKHPFLQCVSWKENSSRGSAPKEIRANEHNLECAVSNYIGEMPFLWLEVEGESKSNNLRSYIERNSIALLSNGKDNENKIDRASEYWLGGYCPKVNISLSGLWNSDYVYDNYCPLFLNEFSNLVHKMVEKF